MRLLVSAKRNGIESILILERDKELGGILNQCIHNGFGLHTFQRGTDRPGLRTEIYLIRQKNLRLNTD